MKEMITTILASLGGAGFITLLLVKFFGNKIVDSIFEEKIENFKYKINLEFDRISKINQKEFEVLPTLWNLLIKHKKNLDLYTSEFESHLNQMSEDQIKNFVNSLQFDPKIKALILQSEDKDKVYKEILLNQGKILLQQSYFSFIYFFEDNKIFMTDEISDKSNEICEFLKSTLTVYDLFISTQPLNVRNAARSDIKRNFDNLTSELGILIKSRLKFPKD